MSNRCRSRNHLRSQRGMTLVEVVVVIAVVGILAAVLSPSITSALKRERQRQVASDVANVFREARNQAMSRGEALTVIAAAPSLVRIVQSDARPRSCREERLVGDAAFGENQERKVYSVAARASANMRLLDDVRVCFDASGGLYLGPGLAAANVCGDERVAVRLADADATDPESALGCDKFAADYEMVGGYVIRLMDSGEISLRTPPNE